MDWMKDETGLSNTANAAMKLSWLALLRKEEGKSFQYYVNNLLNPIRAYK